MREKRNIKKKEKRREVMEVGRKVNLKRKYNWKKKKIQSGFSHVFVVYYEPIEIVWRHGTTRMAVTTIFLSISLSN